MAIRRVKKNPKAVTPQGKPKNQETESNPDGSGRMSEYKEEYPAMLFKHMAEGLSFESFGGVIRAGRETLYRWANKYPPFRHAKSDGEAALQLYYERVGRAGTTTGKLQVKDSDGNVKSEKMHFSPSTWKFMMQARFGWKEHVKIEGGDELTQNRSLSKEEIDKRISDKLKLLQGVSGLGKKAVLARRKKEAEDEDGEE
jgi:hypothetical protein